MNGLLSLTVGVIWFNQPNPPTERMLQTSTFAVERTTKEREICIYKWTHQWMEWWEIIAVALLETIWIDWFDWAKPAREEVHDSRWEEGDASKCAYIMWCNINLLTQSTPLSRFSPRLSRLFSLRIISCPRPTGKICYRWNQFGSEYCSIKRSEQIWAMYSNRNIRSSILSHNNRLKLMSSSWMMPNICEQWWA